MILNIKINGNQPLAIFVQNVASIKQYSSHYK